MLMKALLLLLILTTPAQTIKDGDKITNWTFVASGRDDIAVSYFAPESVKRGEDRIRVWIRVDLPKSSASLFPGTNFYSIRFDTELDCAGGRARSFKTLLYDQSERLARKEKGEAWIKETPDTIGYAVFQYFCEYKENPPQAPPKLKP